MPHIHHHPVSKTSATFGLCIFVSIDRMFSIMCTILTPAPVPHHDLRNAGGAEDESLWERPELRRSVSTTYGRVKSEAGIPRCPVGAIRRHCNPPAL